MTSGSLIITRKTALKSLAQSIGIGLLGGLGLVVAGYGLLTFMGNAQSARNASDAMEAFTPAMELVSPAIVTVTAARDADARAGFVVVSRHARRFAIDSTGPLGADNGRDGLAVVRGSGVLVAPNGLLLTSRHLVQGAEEIVVSMSDGRHFDARIIGSDMASDLAVLAVEAQDLPYVSFADSSKTAVGDATMAIGGRFSDGDAIILGTVSDTGAIDAGAVSFVQTLRAMPPGSQGGAFVNRNGELVAIHTSPWPEVEGGANSAFALPANAARQIMHEILSRGSQSGAAEHRPETVL